MNVYHYFRNKIKNFTREKSYTLFPKSTSIKVSPDLQMGKYVNVNIQDLNVSLEIGANVTFREFCNVLVAPNAKLTIGKNVFFNNYCSINCLKEIVIGNNTMIGESVKFYDHNHEYERNPVKVASDRFTMGPVSIGENCWIASNVTILKGVNIGDNVIIGANNLIYKSIPANSIVKAKTALNIEAY